jgi:hypothetical protein
MQGGPEQGAIKENSTWQIYQTVVSSKNGGQTRL